jgi:hypothetical protein
MIVRVSAWWRPRGGCEQCERGQQGHAPHRHDGWGAGEDPDGHHDGAEVPEHELRDQHPPGRSGRHTTAGEGALSLAEGHLGEAADESQKGHEPPAMLERLPAASYGHCGGGQREDGRRPGQ